MHNNTVDNLSLLLQVLSLEILLRDFNNTDLMQELQRQDTDYFEKIIKNQDEILMILKERRKSDGNNYEGEEGN